MARQQGVLRRVSKVLHAISSGFAVTHWAAACAQTSTTHVCVRSKASFAATLPLTATHLWLHEREPDERQHVQHIIRGVPVLLLRQRGWALLLVLLLLLRAGPPPRGFQSRTRAAAAAACGISAVSRLPPPPPRLRPPHHCIEDHALGRGHAVEAQQVAQDRGGQLLKGREGEGLGG